MTQFHKVLEQKNIQNNNLKIKIREAVRAIIFKNDKILLVHSNKGDYKFPGGGIEEGEDYISALQREITEETGYLNCLVGEKIGVIIQRKLDEYEQESLFQMNSYYYACELTNHTLVEQRLDEYEQIQEFTAVWISIDDAIEQNEKALKQVGSNDWIERENIVLRELKKY